MADVVERYRIVGENQTQAAFRAILRDSESTANRVGSAFKRMFAGLSVAAVGRAFAQTVEFHDELARGAIQSGIATKAYTELAFAARQVDVDQSALATSLKKMQVSLSQATTGGKAQIETLNALGLEIKQLRALDPDKQFEAIAEQISRIKDPADRTRAAVELFGRAGADLLPMFEKGAAGIREARDAAKEFGQSLTEADLEKFRQADDALDAMKESARGLSTALTLELIPDFVELSDKLTVLLGHGSQFKELEVRIRDLRRESDSPIPLYFNFGYIDGAPVVMSPQEILDWIHKLRVEQSKLETGFGTGIRGGKPFAGTGGTTAPPGFNATADQLDKLQPVVVTAKKILEDYGAMLRNTATDAQQAAREYELFRIQLEKLSAAGLIDKDEFNKRLGEFLDKSIPEVEVTAKKIDEHIKQIDRLSTYAEQAARNIQSHFADFLFDPFDKGIKGMLRGFVDVLRRMIAEAAAARILEGLEGKMTGVLGALFGGGSLFGKGIKLPPGSVPTVPGGSFGRGFASGGFMHPGEIGIVGERGPELALAGNKGATIIPFDKARGSATNVTISAPLSIDARGATPDAVKQLTAAMPGILRAHGDQLEARIVERMKRRLYD